MAITRNLLPIPARREDRREAAQGDITRGGRAAQPPTPEPQQLSAEPGRASRRGRGPLRVRRRRLIVSAEDPPGLIAALNANAARSPAGVEIEHALPGPFWLRRCNACSQSRTTVLETRTGPRCYRAPPSCGPGGRSSRQRDALAACFMGALSTEGVTPPASARQSRHSVFHDEKGEQTREHLLHVGEVQPPLGGLAGHNLTGDPLRNKPLTRRSAHEQCPATRRKASSCFETAAKSFASPR